MRILGIDPGSTAMGFAILETTKVGGLVVLHYGATSIKAKELGEKLRLIKSHLEKILKTYRPERAGLERLFFAKNKKTAFEVAQARGVILLTLIEHGLTPVELTPGEIKIAVTNYGAADKQMVAKMVGLLLGISTVNDDDNATDALAVAIAASRTQT